MNELSSPSTERPTVSLYEFADAFSISYRTALRMAHAGSIPGTIRLGKLFRIPRSTVDRMLSADVTAMAATFEAADH